VIGTADAKRVIVMRYEDEQQDSKSPRPIPLTTKKHSNARESQEAGRPDPHPKRHEHVSA
jgi:hypothetical protein